MDAPASQTVTTLKILTLAILVSVGILTSLPFVVDLKMPVGGMPSELPYILLAFSLASLGAASNISKVGAFRTEGKTDKEALKTIYVAHVIRLALQEMPAVLGFVASICTQDRTWGLALGALSIMAILASFPREEDVQRLLAQTRRI